MLNPSVLPDDDGIRPAGKPDECFYCKQKVGQPHLSKCVCLHRKVRVKYTYEIVIEVPHSWTKEQIETHRNDSSWCADNGLQDIIDYADYTGHCLCPSFNCEVIDIPDNPPYRLNKDGEIFP